MKPEVEAESHEESVVCNGETRITRGSLQMVLADLIASQGLRAGEKLRDAGSAVPLDLSISPSKNLSSETPGLADTEQVDPTDLSSQGSEAEEEETLEIEEIIKEKNALWAQYFKPHLL